jgi:hypothetical protein
VQSLPINYERITQEADICNYMKGYNNKNYLKWVRYVREIYFKYKYEDVPDTRIVKNKFPIHGIFINYRQWMNIKNMRIPQQD